MMRAASLVLGVTLAIVGRTMPARAVDLKDCSKIAATADRLTCLEQNVVRLNSAFETAAAELKAGTSRLEKNQIDASKLMKADDAVVLKDTFSNHCISYGSQNSATSYVDCAYSAGQSNVW